MMTLKRFIDKKGEMPWPWAAGGMAQDRPMGIG
jgi:hypothetical protein